MSCIITHRRAPHLLPLALSHTLRLRDVSSRTIPRRELPHPIRCATMRVPVLSRALSRTLPRREATPPRRRDATPCIVTHRLLPHPIRYHRPYTLPHRPTPPRTVRPDAVYRPTPCGSPQIRRRAARPPGTRRSVHVPQHILSDMDIAHPAPSLTVVRICGRAIVARLRKRCNLLC